MNWKRSTLKESNARQPRFSEEISPKWPPVASSRCTSNNILGTGAYKLFSEQGDYVAEKYQSETNRKVQVNILRKGMNDKGRTSDQKETRKQLPYLFHMKPAPSNSLFLIKTLSSTYTTQIRQKATRTEIGSWSGRGTAAQHPDSCALQHQQPWQQRLSPQANRPVHQRESSLKKPPSPQQQ